MTGTKRLADVGFCRLKLGVCNPKVTRPHSACIRDRHGATGGELLYSICVSKNASGCSPMVWPKMSVVGACDVGREG